MKKKNILIIFIILILGGIAVYLYITRSNATFSNKYNDFAIADTGSITKIFMADKNNNTVLLTKNGIGDWTLNKTYKARISGVNMLLETFSKLVTKYPVPKKAHNGVISRLAARSVKVEIYQMVYRVDVLGIKLFPHEKLTKTYFVGDATPDNMGTFLLMEGADVPFVVQLLGLRGFIASRYSTQEKDWRDHTVFRARLNDISRIEVNIPAEPQNSYLITNENDEVRLWKNDGSEPVTHFDTLKVLNYMTAFNDLRYEALLNDIDPHRIDSISNSAPWFIISLIDTKGDTTVMKTFFKPNDSKQFDMYGKLYTVDIDRAYALVNDGRDFVLIQYFVFDKILKPLSFFLPNG